MMVVLQRLLVMSSEVETSLNILLKQLEIPRLRSE